jgi:flagellar protein FliO/FliZ
LETAQPMIAASTAPEPATTSPVTDAPLADATPASADNPAPSVVLHGRTADTLLIPGGSRPLSSLEGNSSGGGSSWFVLLVLCAAGATWWWWWRRRSTGLGSTGLRQIRIEESRPLGNRQYLVIAAIGQKKFLLGVTPGSIQMLTPLEKAESEVHEAVR